MTKKNTCLQEVDGPCTLKASLTPNGRSVIATARVVVGDVFGENVCFLLLA